MPVVFHLGDKSVSIHVEKSWSILFLKQFVCMELKCDPHAHLLSHNGTQLTDWGKVSDFDFLLADETSVDVLPHTNLNHFYVLCYCCDNVTPAVFTTYCDKCTSPDFALSSDVGNPKIKAVSGICKQCQSISGKVFMKCSNDNEHNPVIFLEQVFRNLDNLLCISCLYKDREIIIKFCGDSGHVLCLDCFRRYTESYLSDSRFKMIPDIGLTLSCPMGCPNSHVTDTHLFRILGKTFYSRYKEVAARLSCYSEGIFSCPNCGAFWEPPDFQSRSNWVVCEKPFGCGAQFCSSCHNVIDSDNVGCTCNQYDSIINQPSISDQIGRKEITGSWIGVSIKTDNLATSSLIAASCKTCPRCKSWTSKDGGCNHMTCSICGFEWCWICHTEWTKTCQANHWF
ncbi:unnamed protein product [Rodentolepis nana]|uniref:RBR-type E3 ubiquitin transferase n=1 Tax=Rodentolepis nana TaxID=102285 RepID=A0A0R3T3A7_RODNA|nr:unnamed protein product [Rodentolepis nana]